mmetsp:Transcript_21182/g.43001  ORF Transcript_21182/g.43001 Transcript_21182/m.43001 type:complete len:260 (+) Transcript_21182:288-1067(+)
MFRNAPQAAHADAARRPVDVEMSDAEFAHENRPQSAETVDMELDSPQVVRALYGMPEDCFIHVLRFLSAEQLCLCATVCSDFKRLTAAEQFWQKLCVADYGADTEALWECYGASVDTSLPAYWKRIYRQLMNYRIELHFTGGPRTGEHQPVSKKDCMLGRSRQNDVCILHDEMVSRRHAKIVHHDRHYWIHDVGGINRTFINKRVIKQHNDIRLYINDEVDMGSSTFLIKLLAPSAEEEPESAADDNADGGRTTPTDPR